MPVRLPFAELQVSHRHCRLLRAWVPPALHGTMWSTVNCCVVPHQRQRPSSASWRLLMAGKIGKGWGVLGVSSLLGWLLYAHWVWGW